MEPSGRAALAAGLGILCMLAVAADTRVAEDQGLVAHRRCLLSHYRSLDPRALAAVKALRDSYEKETLGWQPRNCSARTARDLSRPSSCAWLRRVARSIAEAQVVLGGLPSPERFPGAGATLELLEAAGRDVAACLQLARLRPGRRSLQPRRRRPELRRANSARCHEATVIFNLLRLLTRDLRLAATSGPCV
ncbi:interferon lambda-4-like [Octodon degus]|uniref:Interferon lambda-4-like n=1 Tax=Octodon degus TaxID=10160 RepID=A0A6P3FCQ2_OCTDE|nr:interferon lambda-4-like [Octodon degus]